MPHLRLYIQDHQDRHAAQFPAGYRKEIQKITRYEKTDFNVIRYLRPDDS
jgi:hypothetical protein